MSNEGTSRSILPPSSIDRRLLRAASQRKTAEEMAEIVLHQLTPAQCLERVTTILDSKDYLDEVRERKLLVIEASEWMDWIKSQRDNPKSWAQINRAIKVLSDTIERSNINVGDISTKLAVDHARFFAEGFLLGFERVLKALEEREVIALDDDEVSELTQLGIEASSEYLDKVTVRPLHDADTL